MYYVPCFVFLYLLLLITVASHPQETVYFLMTGVVVKLLRAGW
jgi:hypothetical protein